MLSGGYQWHIASVRSPGLAYVCHLGLLCSADRAFLRKWKWSQMVMDEAHALKNANSQRSRRLRKLAAGEWLLCCAVLTTSSADRRQSTTRIVLCLRWLAGHGGAGHRGVVQDVYWLCVETCSLRCLCCAVQAAVGVSC